MQNEFQNKGLARKAREFKSSVLKIAIQKDGELTDLSIGILSKISKRFLFLNNLAYPKKLFGTVPYRGNRIGYVYAKNNDLCRLVSCGSVDLAIVGLDRVIEENYPKNIEIIKTFKDSYSWPVVVAVPSNYDAKDLDRIKILATKFPMLSKKFLPKLGIGKFNLVVTHGSTEIMPYLTYLSTKVDAIVDLMITGKSLRDNSLIPVFPPLTYVYPVLITNKSAHGDLRKKKILERFIGLRYDARK